MAIQEAPATCPTCGPVLARRPGTNHVLHLLITVLTCSFWIPIWILVSVRFGGWRCSNCGRGARAQVSIVSLILAAFLLLLFGVFAIAIIWTFRDSRETSKPPSKPTPVRVEAPVSKDGDREKQDAQARAVEKKGLNSDSDAKDAPPSTSLVAQEEKVEQPHSGVRKWRSKDGREILGRIENVNLVTGTVDIVRADGQVFKAYPIANLNPDDAALIPQESATQKVEPPLNPPQ